MTHYSEKNQSVQIDPRMTEMMKHETKTLKLLLQIYSRMLKNMWTYWGNKEGFLISQRESMKTLKWKF